MTGASAGSLRHSPVSTVHIRQNTIQVDSINRITDKSNSQQYSPGVTKQRKNKELRDQERVHSTPESGADSDDIKDHQARLLPAQQPE